MESMASAASSSTSAQNVQHLRQLFLQNDLVMQEETAFQQKHMLGEMDRSMKNRMSDEIVSILSDVMTSMKKTGDEIRNAGR
jgi:hypothetical protein